MSKIKSKVIQYKNILYTTSYRLMRGRREKKYFKDLKEENSDLMSTISQAEVDYSFKLIYEEWREKFIYDKNRYD